MKVSRALSFARATSFLSSVFFETMAKYSWCLASYTEIVCASGALSVGMRCLTRVLLCPIPPLNEREAIRATEMNAMMMKWNRQHEICECGYEREREIII